MSGASSAGAQENHAKLPKGFRASGTTCGIKVSGKSDLSLFVSDCDASGAGVFTQNRVCGAPVTVSKSRVPGSELRGVIVNSGNSNACTGDPGLADARKMTAAVASELSCDAEQILICSTGVIGVPLPMDCILRGIPHAVSQLCSESQSFMAAATAMMTTDTFAKLCHVDVQLAGGTVRVAGVAKGAAMIAPNMATMLSVIMTDARLTPEQCDWVLRYAVDRTFNCISVDGHTSTSDTVLLLANGASGVDAQTDDESNQIRDAVMNVCQALSTSIIRDAEGCSHFVTIDVTGLSSRDQAFRMARSIADSPLVKTAIAGADPNWGRIVSAAGYAGVPFEPSWVTLKINGTEVYRAGVPVVFKAAELSASMRENRDVHIEFSVAGGPSSGMERARFWTSDLTCEYVRLNSEYTT
ncbi:MAG: bifunctional glutamate N-acetyltransferase/amino-acid acetyltransferase ArgJ [Planctomyces sp.]|nr:bifunctional glutamate N-acetyltransferase/amino-acid acetyltransferase ArgJ [Planctomyces sp.]